MTLRVGNGTKIATKAVGTYLLQLQSDFRLDLKNYYFISVASQNLISISVLAQDRFIF